MNNFLSSLVLFWHFWQRSYKITKIFRNLCLHFARQDGRNGKKIPQLDWPKYVPKTRIPNTKMKYMEWMKQINSFFLQNVFENGHNWSKHSTTRKAWRGWIQRSTDHFGQRSLKFRMNLWGHRFSQNANHKLQGFLPYPNKDRNTFFGWCFGQCRNFFDYDPCLFDRTEILVIFGLHFGRNNDLINLFWI